MNMLPLINNFTKNFNEKIGNDFNVLNLESNLIEIGDDFTSNFLVSYLEYLDDEFCSSSDRKEAYYVKEYVTRQLLTSLGPITLRYRIYQSKSDKHCYSFIRDDVLKLVRYQRMTNQAELSLIKYAMDENMSQSSRHAIRNTVVSRATVSNKIKKIKGSLNVEITRAKETPEVIYIEMDEVHANLQHGGNNICPCAVVHEGHEEEFTKRKKLKNCYNFGTATKGYDGLWYLIYDYLDTRYDLDKIKYIFVSGDGASGIKDYDLVLPNAIYVLDKFHYKKALKYIFKKNKDLIKIADEYLRNDSIDDFKALVDAQIKLYPDQKEYIIKKSQYLLNNIEGIKNQTHPKYKCPCAMEGQVSNKYARYITSSPYGFSLEGLENKIKLLVLHANKHELSIEDYLTLKGGNDYQSQLINSYKEFKSDFKNLKDKFIVHTIPNAALVPANNNYTNITLRNITNIKCTI